jgi:hypothetical protein
MLFCSHRIDKLLLEISFKKFPTTSKLKALGSVTGASWVWWLSPIILATWEEEIERITVPGQPRQKIPETPS